MKHAWLSHGLLWSLGLFAFFPLLAPFWQSEPSSPAAPLLGFVMTCTVLLLILLLLRTFHPWNSLQFTLLAVLAVLSGLLRLLPIPSGFSAAFLLPLLGGWAFGPMFGFLLGAFSIFISALISGGVGPWLPYQILAMAWVGYGAGWLRRKHSHMDRKRDRGLLALYAMGISFIYGAALNLWFWPMLRNPEASVWQDYFTFYMTTSFWWDFSRALGNVLLIAWFAPPLSRILLRFRRRFSFERA